MFSNVMNEVDISMVGETWTGANVIVPASQCRLCTALYGEIEVAQ